MATVCLLRGLEGRSRNVVSRQAAATFVVGRALTSWKRLRRIYSSTFHWTTLQSVRDSNRKHNAMPVPHFKLQFSTCVFSKKFKPIYIKAIVCFFYRFTDVITLAGCWGLEGNSKETSTRGVGLQKRMGIFRYSIWLLRNVFVKFVDQRGNKRKVCW